MEEKDRRGATNASEKTQNTLRRRRTTYPRTARYPSHALLGIDAAVNDRKKMMKRQTSSRGEARSRARDVVTEEIWNTRCACR